MEFVIIKRRRRWLKYSKKLEDVIFGKPRERDAAIRESPLRNERQNRFLMRTKKPPEMMEGRGKKIMRVSGFSQHANSTKKKGG